jgi:ABC-2 type transport system permease protein
MSPRRVCVMVANEARLARRDPIPLFVLIVFPLISIAFLKPVFGPALAHLGYRSANGSEQVVPGQAVMAAFFAVSLVTSAFFSEHAWVTWDRLRASAAAPLEIVVAKALPRAVAVAFEIAVLLAVGTALFGLHIRGSAVALIPVVVAFALALVTLGVAVTALSRTAQQANAFAYLGMVAFGAVGGAFVPIALLPAWARTVAPATPTYWAMRAMRSVVLDGRGGGATALPTLVLLAMAGAFTLLALTRLRFDDPKTGWA